MALSFTFRHGISTIHGIVKEVSGAIWLALCKEYVSAPSSADQWRDISDGFRDRWNLPHCLGAIDGKHVNMQKPANSGAMFYNYKGSFSVNLMATCDANYCFLVVDVGQFGQHSDGGVFASSAFGQALCNNQVPLPRADEIHGIGKMPYFFVGDEAFPLKPYLMRPFLAEV